MHKSFLLIPENSSANINWKQVRINWIEEFEARIEMNRKHGNTNGNINTKRNIAYLRGLA